MHGVINADDIEELITLALREGALTMGERKNVERIRDDYINARKAMAQDQAAAKKQAEEAAQAAAAEKSKQEGEKQEAPKEKISGKDFTPRVNGNHQKKVEAASDPAADLQSHAESV